MNESSEFEKLFTEIYPPMLELKKENVSNFSASFLDLFISIVNRRFDYKLSTNAMLLKILTLLCFIFGAQIFQAICFTGLLVQKIYASVALLKPFPVQNAPGGL